MKITAGPSTCPNSTIQIPIATSSIPTISSPKLFRDERGQSFVELLLGSVFFMMVIFFFVQMAMLLSFGHYAQYAVFMSSRALLSGSGTRQSQIDRAKNVMSKMLYQNSGADRFKWVAKSDSANATNELGSGTSLTTARGTYPGDPTITQINIPGVRYTFRGKLLLAPPMNTSTNYSGGVPFDAESFLGREVTFEECQQLMQSNGKQWTFDNGC